MNISRKFILSSAEELREFQYGFSDLNQYYQNIQRLSRGGERQASNLGVAARTDSMNEKSKLKNLK